MSSYHFRYPQGEFVSVVTIKIDGDNSFLLEKISRWLILFSVCSARLDDPNLHAGAAALRPALGRHVRVSTQPGRSHPQTGRHSQGRRLLINPGKTVIFS